MSLKLIPVFRFDRPHFFGYFVFVVFDNVDVEFSFDAHSVIVGSEKVAIVAKFALHADFLTANENIELFVIASEVAMVA